MDIEEFEKRVKPSAKRSRLEPFRSQIFELKAKGYADWQVRDWLAANGLEVSRQAVQQFIKKGEQAQRVHAADSTEKAQRVHAATGADTPAAAPQVLTPKESGQTAEPRKITNPADIRKARKREIDLSDFSEPDKE